MPWGMAGWWGGDTFHFPRPYFALGEDVIDRYSTSDFHVAAVFGIPVSSPLPVMWSIFSVLGGLFGGGTALCSQVASVRCCPPLSQLVNHTGTPAGPPPSPSYCKSGVKWPIGSVLVTLSSCLGLLFFLNSIFQTCKAEEIQERIPSEGNHHQLYQCPHFILKSIYIDFRADSKKNNGETDFFFIRASCLDQTGI